MHSSPIVTWTLPAFAPATSARPWIAGALLALAGSAHAAQSTIIGPAGSGEFGRTVTVLPNGNIVVTDPGFDEPAPGDQDDVGAVYLHRPDGALVSTLRGGSANDRVGSGGVVVLANGNFVVGSPDWANDANPGAGAVTFGSASGGVSGVVSPANSLVGSTEGDRIGSSGVTTLVNGNYVVGSRFWDNGASVDAVTFGSGTSGVSGVVSPANSLVGSAADDRVGSEGVTALSSGNYVVRSPSWDDGPSVDVGAVTFGSGTSGISGAVSSANSLVGGTLGDRVGSAGVTALDNGNYVVRSPRWDHDAAVDAGAATFGSGTSGISGVVTAANSLVGSTADDQVGLFGVTALRNGNYVVSSAFWDNGTTVNAGAVTFGSGVSGISGVVSAANSLVGSKPHDGVGESGVTALTNGNYVVRSPSWDNGPIPDAGAVTFGFGTLGIRGEVSPANSLVGSSAGDIIGNRGVTALANGNYVVLSTAWANGLARDAGAVTFGSGTLGIRGAVSPANSLVGLVEGDRIGNAGVTALANGNYVVSSAFWDNGGIVNAGAATFGSGTSGISGLVSPANSLVGSAPNDTVGSLPGFFGPSGVTALGNGNYVVGSPRWDNGGIVDAGAVTFGSGTNGVSGVVSPTNSLVGSTAGDIVGSFVGGAIDATGVTALENGNYVVSSPRWDNAANVDAGAVTFGSGTSGVSGVVSPANSLAGARTNDFAGFSGATALGNGNYAVNSPRWDYGSAVDAGAITLGLSKVSVVGVITDTHSVLGTAADQGPSQSFDYDAERNQLVVGQPGSNRVVLHRTGIATATSSAGGTPDPSLVGQPVTFAATVSASPDGPTNGQVTFSASSGERCVDTTPTATSATTAEFSCTIAFTATGSSTVVAEYTGSNIHAYSSSPPEAHTTLAVAVFANGFEGP